MNTKILIDQFKKTGYLNFGEVLDKKKCKEISSKLLKKRPWNQSIFRTYEDVFKNPRHLNVAPKKNGFNLAEKLNLNFIEKKSDYSANIIRNFG